MSVQVRESAAAALGLPGPGRIGASIVPAVAYSHAPLRVCHVMSADLWAGAEVQVAAMAAYLVKDPGVEVSAVLMNEGPLVYALRRLGVRVEVVDETRVGALGILRFLTRFFKEHHIQLVHTHRYKDSVLGALAAKLAGVPNIVRTVHGLREPMTGWDRLKFRVYETLDKATLVCFADLILAVSRQIAETLRESGYRPTMVSHIHNGVDLGTVGTTRSREETRALLGLDSHTVLFGTAGRLSPVKGHAGLLRAARMVLETLPTARLVIAGGGPLAGELRAYAGCLGIDNKCLFLGPRSDVHDLIAAMDVFVLPSLHEGIPMAVLEAMALGTPVVATDVGGTPEVIQHGVNGLLVPSGDDRALADACVDLVADPFRARSLAVNARRTVEDAFSHERSGRDLVDVYRSISRAPGNGGPHTRLRFVPGPDVRPPVTMRRLTRAVFRRALDSGTQAVERARGKREMNRVRRNPEPLRVALRSAARVLIVCHGNIIRSPFAANLLVSLSARLLQGRRPVTVLSAGLEAKPGNPTHPTALRLAGTHQVDLSRHEASRVDPADVAASDVIFVMDVPQLVALRRRFPAARQKAFLLACLAPGVPLEITDPIGGDDLAFTRCFENISRAAEPIARTLFASRGR